MRTGFVIVDATTGQAAIVIRAASCEDVGIDQGPSPPTAPFQIKINLFRAGLDGRRQYSS